MTTRTKNARVARLFQWAAMASLFAVGVCAEGCSSGDNAEPDGKATESTTSDDVTVEVPVSLDPSPSTAANAAGSEVPEPSSTRRQSPPPPPEIKPVVMSQEHLETCIVRTGGEFPRGTLANVSGDEQSIEQLLGTTCSVILFWSEDDPYGVAALRELNLGVQQQYANSGVQVIGVHVGEDTEAAKARIDETGATFPQLVDPDGSYFSSVASEMLPRVYLLDTSGTVAWFDVEYSRETRRLLLDAIAAITAE